MKLSRYVTYILLCFIVLLDSCSKDEDADLRNEFNPSAVGSCFPPLLPNLRNYPYPFITRMGEIEEEPQGHRVPSRVFECTVDRNDGVWIEGVNTEELLSYEIHDKEGVCAGIFLNEWEFISFMYSVSGFYTVCLFTPDYCFAGPVELSENVFQGTVEDTANPDKRIVFILNKYRL